MSPRREVLRIALPAALGLLSYAVMQGVDCAFLGHYDAANGTVDQAGAGLTMILVWALMCPVLGTMSGIATFSAQYTGAGRFYRAGRHLRSVLAVAVVVALPYYALALAAPEIVKLFGADPDVALAAGKYLGIRLLGAAFMAVSMGSSCFLRGTGNAVTPLIVSLLANALNLGLDYVLVFGHLGLPAFGVRGAAAATVAAQAFEAACFLWLALGPGGLRRDFRIGLRGKIHWVEVRRLVRVGGPIGAYWFCEASAWAGFMLLMGTFKSAAVVKANFAAFQVMHFSFLPVVGLLQAAQALVGKYVGAGDPVTARARGFLCMRMGMLFMTAMGVMMFVFRHALIGIFSPEPDVIAIGAASLIWVAILQPADAMSMTLIGALRGAGDTVFAFWLMTAVAWLVFLPVTYVVAFTLGGGPVTAWLGANVYMAFLAIVTTLRWRSRAWQGRRI